MPLTSLWEALGGLGLFLLGMRSLSDGLQKLAGGRVRVYFEKITGNRLTSALAGSCLASLLQSGSAAAIIVIGFINAGLVSIYQALAVLLGTGIGATLAIQLIAFRIYSVALPTIFLGVILKYFFHSRRLTYIGDLLLGVGLVFYGLQMLEAGLIPVKESTLFQAVHGQFLDSRAIAVLLGAVVTFLVQSSSAAAGIVIAITGSGLLSLQDGIAMIIGEVLGASFIAAVASINGTPSAKRTALVYFLMNVVSISIALLCFPYFLRAISVVTPGTGIYLSPLASDTILNSASGNVQPIIFRSLANAHTIFSIFNLLLFLPLVGVLSRSASGFLPGDRRPTDLEPRCRFIDVRVVNTPTLALVQAKSELKRMADIAKSMFDDVVRQLHEFDARRSSYIRQKEEVLDVLQREISSFLVVLSRQSVSISSALELPILIHVVNNLEHIGDQNQVILDCLYRKKERQVHFSGAAMEELKSLADRVSSLLGLALESLGEASEEDLNTARSLKDTIHARSVMMSNNHVERLTKGECTVLAGVVYSDMISAFMKITEYAYNIMKTERELL